MERQTWSTTSPNRKATRAISSLMLGNIDSLGERLMAAAESKPGPLAMRNVLEGRKSYSRGFTS